MRVRASDSFIKDLSALSAVDSVQAAAVREAFDADGSVIHRPEDLIVQAARHIELPVAQTLVRLLLAFASMRQQADGSVDELNESIRSRIATIIEPGQQAKAICGLELLLGMVESRSAERTSRAIDLSYDYANLLHQTRILTDIRPLFSTDGSQVEGAVVAHTLRIRFDTAGVPSDVSYALDENDLRILRDQCERALIKATTARLVICGKAGVPPLITSDENHAN